MRLSACTATATGFSLTGDAPTMTSQAYATPRTTDYVIVARGRTAAKDSIGFAALLYRERWSWSLI